ncbi:unknown [Clostridium sp. CAG:149]|nr:unknown [Clostridium sp. CAG:149]
MPAPLMTDTMMEKMIPDTTGAGIAYLRRSAECATIARPAKITMAAKPRVVRYSNLNDATAPSAAGVYVPK